MQKNKIKQAGKYFEWNIFRLILADFLFHNQTDFLRHDATMLW